MYRNKMAIFGSFFTLKNGLGLALLILLVTPLFAQTEECFEVEQLRDGTLSITDFNFDEYMRGNLVIPQKLFGANVTRIGPSAFARSYDVPVGWSGFVSITIPNGIVEIGALAFHHILSKEETVSITLPAGLKIIGNLAFSELVFQRGTGAHVKSIILPPTLERIGSQAFSDKVIEYLKIENAFAVPSDKPVFFGADIKCIEIIGNLSDAWLNGTFSDSGFKNFYVSQGRRAGIYLWNGRIWTVGTRQDVNKILAAIPEQTPEKPRNPYEGTTLDPAYQLLSPVSPVTPHYLPDEVLEYLRQQR